MYSRVILIFIFITGKNCNFTFEDSNEAAGIFGKHIAKLIGIFDDYHRFFYIDQNSLDLYENTRRFLVQNNRKFPIFLFNWDQVDFKRFERGFRPLIPRALHVMFSLNLTLWECLNHYKKVNYRDVVLFVGNNLQEVIQNQINMIRFVGKTLLLELKGTEIKLYQICYYCGLLKNHFQEISMDKTVLPDEYRDLNGHQLKLVFMPNYPFTYCNNFTIINGRKICLEINGIESHMIKLISRKMNFTFTVYQLDADRSSYLNMLQNMESHDTDLAFGAISMTLNRRNVIEFTTQYHAEDYNLMYKTSLNFLDVLEKFFDPFSSPMLWVLFLLAYVLIAVILYLMQIRKSEMYQDESLRNCFWILLQVQLEQAVSGDSFKSASKRNPCWGAMLLLWCACCMVLCAAYKGATLSALVRPSRSEPENLAELVTAGYRIVASNQSVDIIQDLLNVSDPIYRQTMKRMKYGTTICQVFSDVLSDNRIALMNEWSMIQFQIRRQCDKPSDEQFMKIRIARHAVMNAGHAWATRLGAPYKQAIDHYLGLILSGGLFNKWKSDYTFQQIGSNRPKFRLSRELRGDDVQTVTLTLPTFYPLFLIYGIGICCATISFGYEVIKFHYQKKKKIIADQLN